MTFRSEALILIELQRIPSGLVPIQFAESDVPISSCEKLSVDRIFPLAKFEIVAITAPTARALRLSVRTPDFHSGKRGSIPLGRATYFKKVP